MVDSTIVRPRLADKYWGARGVNSPLGKNRLRTPGFAPRRRRGSGLRYLMGTNGVGAGPPCPAGITKT